MTQFRAVLDITTKDRLTLLEENELKRDLDKLDPVKYEIILRFVRPESRNTNGVWESKTKGSYSV